ncbi:MAG: NAD(P)/FAD-dependent oxidoreductase [Oscillospiraceae bacterium]|nr:NAD(P)/FAD-dependent oxidoreductase [Oscillospiraceae bacterium]
MYDVAIIGAGVIGSLTARELSRFKLKTALLEAANDVAMGATKANSGIVHAGFDAVPGTLKAKFNVKGASMMADYCKQLSVPYKNNGSLVVAFSEEEKETLDELYNRGIANGVEELRIIDREELVSLEPNISDEAVAALVAPTAGIVCPYELTIAAAENAVSNGVQFIRNCRVTAIRFKEGVFSLETAQGMIEAKYVVNAAGVHSDEIAKMVGDNSFDIIPRAGEYFILDKSVGNLVSHTIFQCPSKLGKGVLVTGTVDGNLLIGPTASDIEDKDNKATTLAGLNDVKKLASKSCKNVSARNAITSFTGVRARATTDDFIIGPIESNAQFINAAGIESPGLSSAPAIAVYLAHIICEALGEVEVNESFNGVRRDVFRFRHATDEEKAAAIEKDPAYGRIVCRCETITEGEIIDAIRAPAGARDVDGVKRRTRAGMGRCQGGFCGSKVVEILARELGKDINEITKFGNGSVILFDKTK